MTVQTPALPDRLLVAAGAVAGLLGVALSAAAAHAGGSEPGTLRTAAQFLLFHAPLVVGLAGLGASGTLNRRAARLSALALLVGLVLFSGDLSARALLGTPLFPMAAPAGGLALMTGWLLVAVAALVPVRSP